MLGCSVMQGEVGSGALRLVHLRTVGLDVSWLLAAVADPLLGRLRWAVTGQVTEFATWKVVSQKWSKMVEDRSKIDQSASEDGGDDEERFMELTVIAFAASRAISAQMSEA